MEQLIAAWNETMERGETDQWKLAEIAFLAGELHGGIKAFAEGTKYTAKTISRYKTTYMWGQANGTTSYHLSFAEAFTLANMSEDRAAAVMTLADMDDKSVNTVREDKERVKVVEDFLIQNPELVKDALKNADARSAVAAAAFKAATEDVVVEATGITKEAAKEKTPKKNTSMRAAQVEQLKYKASRVGHWAESNLPSIIRETEALAEYMTEDELLFVFNQLGLAHDLISQARATVRDLVASKQTV